MFHSRAKSLNQTQPTLLLHFISLTKLQLYHTLRRPNKPNTKKPRREQRPHRDAAKLRKKPIHFVSDVKQTHDPEDALSLFREYDEMGFKHDYPSYSALIYKLARSRNFEAVETILGHVKDRNIQCKDTLFIALFQHYGKANLVEKAVELFNQMDSYNCVRTLQCFNSLLNVVVDSDRFADAEEIFGRCREMGFRPNSISYNIMVKGWLRRGEVGEARKVFDEMLERKVQPSVVTYNSLIGFFSRKGEVEEATGLLEDMRQKGKYPNAVTYALLMEGLCIVGKYDEAKKMMFDMAYRGCKPGIVNYGVLISDLGRREKLEEAKSLLQEMKKRRFKPDVGGFEPNAATYRMMVDGFCQIEEFEGGLKVLIAMLKSKHCPRLTTFECLFEGLLKCGKVDGASFVLEEMENRNMQLCCEAWEAPVLDACGKDIIAGEIMTEVISSYSGVSRKT
ncbi:pentatricopeptide repeat-containing protein At1g07740, mitochondrial isoform X2 [Argentina anserina]|uniref:pentatricopeptide repeat-containing protein At1g07740, mitochondrial isoform X2 n=1 Tax=Argentina anserina TaxID=57926 RepID=UPI0021762D59|nr:pentatricopeptide repeat-containing protein At1g07740, mitochondrial isoform X2 [Potentilla anserina]